MTLMDQLQMLRKARHKPSAMPEPVHPDVADLCVVLETKLAALSRDKEEAA